jgi:hypothetical protein
MFRLLLLCIFVALVAATGCDDAAQTDDQPQPSVDTGPSADTTGEDAGPGDEDSGPSDRDSGPSDQDSGPSDEDSGEQTDCVPSEQAWDLHSRDYVDTYCGKCHGETPDFGAPYSLLDYDELVSGQPGERRVDKMAQKLLDRSMPPPTESQLPHDALDTLVEWATCGEEHPDHSDGLWASEPVWTAAGDPPAGSEHFDVTADSFQIDVNTLDHYQCFVVEAPIDSERFIRRFEPVIDDSRVLHHLLVSIDRNDSVSGDSFECSGFPPGDSYVYVWAPGTEPLQFEDGGLSIEPGDKFVLQIHYNNGAGVPDVEDSSGFRVYHDAPGGTEYGLGAVGTPAIYVPANDTGRAGDSCVVQQDVYIRASWPHMHEIGSEFETVITRKDGTEETLIELTGWDFEAQYFYDTPVHLEAGDEISTVCTYDNPYDHAVYFGEGTGDEMCFNFLYMSPPMDSPCQ